MPAWISDLLKRVLAESPTLLTCLAVIYYAFQHVTREHKSHLESKDKEIERLVDEKNRLQELLLDERLSTTSRTRAKSKR